MASPSKSGRVASPSREEEMLMESGRVASPSKKMNVWKITGDANWQEEVNVTRGGTS